MAKLLKFNTPLLIAVMYLVVSLVIAYVESRRLETVNHEKVQQALAEAGKELTAVFNRHLFRYQYGVRGVRGVVLASSEELNLKEFQRYSASRNIDSEFPGARGFGFIRRVPVNAEMQFLQQERLHGYRNFNIRQLEPHDGERFIIEYIEPVERNRQAVGLDIASERNRREAAWDALRSGEIRLTAPITLVQAMGQVQQSFLLLMPVYPSGITPATEAERIQAGIGWAYAPLVIGEVMETLLWNREAIHLELYDATDPAQQIQVFSSGSLDGLDPANRQVIHQQVYGRDWHLEIIPKPAFIESLGLWNPLWTMQVGALFSFLLSLCIWAILNSRRFKLEVDEQKDRVMALVNSSSDALVFCNNDGLIKGWNPAAEQMFGYSTQEAMGRYASDLFVPESLRGEEEEILALIVEGSAVPHFHSRRIHKSGTEIDVSISVAPQIQHGEVVGYAKTIRDISDDMKAQRQIMEMNRNLESLVEKRTEELAKSKMSLQGILDNMPSRVAYWDADLNLIMANRGALSTMTTTSHDAFGKPMKTLMTERGMERIKPFFDEVRATRRTRSEEMTVAMEGQTHHLLLVISPQIQGDSVTGFYTISSDVTEIRENQMRLASVMRENEALLATINEQMLYSVTDARGVMLDVNDNFCRASGYTREELVGNSHNMLNSKAHPRGFWRDMWRTVSSGLPWRGDVCNRCKDGELRWFDTVIAPFIGADGRVERFVALRTDITEKREVEEERNYVNAMLSGVLNACSEVSIIAGDTDGVITIFNTGAEAMLGYTAEEMVGRHTPAIVHREDEVVARGLEMTEEFGEEIAGFEVFVYLARKQGYDRRQWTYVRKDGSELRVSLVVTAMYDDRGQLSGYLGVALDITAEEESRRRLVSARDQLTIAANVADLGIWSHDSRTNELEWNPRMCEIFGVPENQVVTTEQWGAATHPEDLKSIAREIASSLQQANEYQLNYRIYRPSGELRWVQVGAQVDRDEMGNVTTTTGICRDITEQLNLEHELRRAKELADSSNAAKSAFLANMSHEIRTPMNAVLGMLKLVRNTSLNERQLDYVDKANTAAKSLLELLNDLLDFSKIEADKLVLEREQFALDSLMQDIGVVLGGYQHNKAVELIFDIDPSLPTEVLGDPLRLKQILINLGGNALKFTERGHVIVRLKKLHLQDGSVQMRIEVEDSGIGISKDQRERIFDDFIQAESSTARRFGGTGLGLVICKRLVGMMGGELCVESEFGLGSRFWFDVSLDAASDQPLVRPGQRGHILLVGSSDLLVSGLSHCIDFMGYRIDRVSAGADAISKVKVEGSHAAGYDLVILDWWLSDLSGMQTAEFIANSQLQASPKILLLAPSRGEIVEARTLGEESCIDGVLTKPFTPLQLQQSIDSLIHGRSAISVAEEQPGHSSALQGLRLLVVEDNELNRQIAEELLSDEGAIVDLASGGLEGVEKVLDRSNKYDLVVMDMQMPDIDGLEATRRIRAEQGFETLPIMAMTANASLSDRELCLQSGMNEHIGKPIDMNEVIPCILNLVGREENTSPATLQSNDSASIRGEVEKRFGGNMKMFCRVQPKYESTVNQLISELRAALGEHNYTAVCAALHSLKGTSGTMGAKELSTYTASLESEIKSRKQNQWRTVLSSNAMVRLSDLAAASVAAMQLMFDEFNSREPENASSSQLSVDELKHQLQEMVPLLQADNLRALKILESIQTHVNKECRAQLEPLSSQINALDFAAALETISHLTREL